MRRLVVTLAWLPLAFASVATLPLLPDAWPAWVRMWALSGAIFFACKWLTWLGSGPPRASMARHASYWLLWPGLDAEAFLGAKTATAPPRSEWLEAGTKTLAGLVSIAVLAPAVAALSATAAGWVAMVGLLLALHFGTLHLLSCAWRAQGIQARPLQDRPTLSVSVAEFWGRRWNTAFRDMTHRFLFEPITARWGPKTAFFAGFVASGLVHDLVISGPARGGYGLPTLFFLIQAAAAFFERSRRGRRLGLGRGSRGRLFAYLVLLAPLPLLAHGPFMARVMIPFFQAAGAIP